jgi:hypothetical protein
MRENYDPTTSVDISSGDSPMAVADQQTAQTAQDFATKMSGIVQDQVDLKQSQQSSIEATQKGIAWTPKSNLTEAGRSWNQTGLPIATSMAESDLVGHLNSLSQEQLNSPVSPDNAKTYQANSQAYIQSYLQNTPTQMQASLTQASKAAYLSGLMPIIKRQADYTRSNTVFNLNQTAQNLSDSAANLATQSMASTDPVLQNLGMQQAHDQLIQQETLQQQIAALNGNFSQAGPAIQTGKVNFITATVLGRQKSFLDAYQNTNDPSYLQQAQSISDNFMDDQSIKSQLSKISPDDNVTANTQYQISKQLSAQYNHFVQGQKSSNSVDQLGIKNAVIGATYGQQPSPEILAQMNPTQMDDLRANQTSSQIFSDLKAQGLPAMQSYLNKLNDPSQPNLLPGLDNYASQKTNANVMSMAQSFVKQVSNDPYKFVSSMPAYQNYINKQYTTLNSTDKNVSNQQLQAEVSQSLNNPIVNFQSLRSPDAKQAMFNTFNQANQLQNQNGIKPEMQNVISNSDAQSIVSNLNNLPNTDRMIALQNAQKNYGQNWAQVQNSLLNNKMPYSDIIASNLYNNPQTQSIANNVLNAQNAIQLTGNKFWETIGTTYDKASIAASTNPLMQNAFNSILQYPGSQAVKAVNGLKQTIINNAAIQIQKNGYTWGSSEGQNILEQSTKDVLYGLYQNGAQDGIRVPYTAQITDPKGNVNNVPIDYNNVKQIMAYYKSRAPQLAMVSNPTNIATAKWVNTPNSNGLQLVTNTGAPIYNKQGKTYSFSWSVAANPSLMPSDYHNFIKPSITSILFNSDPNKNFNLFGNP